MTKDTLRFNRRKFLKSAGAASGAALATPLIASKAFAYNKPIELIHWSWLAASDGEVWAQMIDAFKRLPSRIRW